MSIHMFHPRIATSQELFVKALLLALLLGWSPTAHAQEDIEARAFDLQRRMESLVDAGRITGGITLLSHRGQVVHFAATGKADRELNRQMRTDSIFRIASMSKPITSVAIMMLYEDGKLALDDPASKYIPAFKSQRVLVSTEPLRTVNAKSEITIRQLLTHTSGLGYTSSPDVGPLYIDAELPSGLCTTSVSLEQYVDRLAKIPLAFQPGERFLYGASTDVLGRIVEVVSGVPFDTFLQDRIFRRLKMVDTSFKVPPAKRDRLVAAYVSTKQGLRKINGSEFIDYEEIGGITRISADYPINPDHKCFFGGGGLCSTASDYLRFCQMLANGGKLGDVRLLEQQTVQLMVQNHIHGKQGFAFLPGGFGLGFHVFADSEDIDEQLHGAYAWFGFWSTSFRIAKSGDWILITMAQVTWNEGTMETFTKYENTIANLMPK